MSLLLFNWALDGLSSHAVCYREQVRIGAFRVAEIVDPAHWIVASKDVTLVGFYKKQRGAFVVAILMESLWHVLGQQVGIFICRFICILIFVPAAVTLSIVEILSLLLVLDSLRV